MGHRAIGTDKLELRNYSITGPVFSGPQEQPFFCQTHQFRVYPNGPFLTANQIADPCHVPSRVDYVYRTTAGVFTAFDPSAPLPADLAMTTTVEGKTAPYIVRLETGTINRATMKCSFTIIKVSAETTLLQFWPSTLRPTVRRTTPWAGAARVARSSST
jgi:Tannase-like family of unknown function (DUF6351)